MAKDDEEEGCAAQCRKIRSALIHYGSSFFAVCCSYVAFGVAQNSAPMKDPSNWVASYHVDMWFGNRPYISQMLKACAVAGMVRFVVELTSMILCFMGVYKILRYMAIINMIVLILFVLPVVILGYTMVASLNHIPDTNINGHVFHHFLDYKMEIDHMKSDPNHKPYAALSHLQERIGWIQAGYSCCGMNHTKEWDDLRPNYNADMEGNVVWNLRWWLYCTIKNETYEYKDSKFGCDIPYTCCNMEHMTWCNVNLTDPKKKNESIAFQKPCKKALTDTLINCILFSCVLLTMATILGGIGAVIFFLESTKGIERQRRYLAWRNMIKKDDDPPSD